MLCAATSAPKTALSQCSSERNWYSYSTWGARDVAGNEDAVGHHPVDVEGAAAGVAGHAPEAGGEPSTLQPFGVADRPERRQHHVDVERTPVGKSGTPHVAARVAFQRLD